MLERMEQAAGSSDRLTIQTLLEVAGYKSFGPLLLFAGLVAFSPASGVPGVPTMVGLIVLLTTGQVLFGRRHIWLPTWLVQRSVSGELVTKSLRCMMPVARFVDRLFRPRIKVLTHRTAGYFIATVCALIAVAMPPMELVPFAATSAGAAFVVFGLALIVHDGLMTLLAMAATVASATLFLRAAF
jgi:hypothetical protein